MRDSGTKVAPFGGPAALCGAVAVAIAAFASATPAWAQNGRWCQANPERCARLKARIRARCAEDPAWCARLRERIRTRRAASGTEASRLNRSTLKHGGAAREYWWMTPPGVRGNAPLVVVLHGGGGRALQIARYTGFSALARSGGFSVVYPQGVRRRWNDGRKVNNRTRTDDVGFLRRVVRTVIAQSGRIDPRRVFFTGISNGGFMAMRMACDAGNLVAGIAAVTAQFNGPLSRRCRASRPVPVLLMNGTEDPLVPYGGGAIGGRFFSRGTAASTDATIAFWRRRNGCLPSGYTVRLPDNDRTDGVTTLRTRWISCKSGAPVVLYKLVGGGHTWPGKRPYLPARVIGRTSRDFDGTRVIWQFFASLPPKR